MNGTTLYDPPMIGSPRVMSPRSHRTHRSGHSNRPRRHRNHERNETDDSHTYEENASEPPPTTHLHPDDSTFNVDPTAPMLGAGEESMREAIAAEEHRNELREESKKDRSFVGGFVMGLKKALKPTWDNQQRSDPEAAYPETPYTADDTYSSAQQPAVIESHHTYALTDSPYREPPPEPHPPPPPSSETMHATTEYPDDGTTAVDHQMTMPTPGHYVNPIFVEPQPAPDYAKMETPSPTASEASFNTYMSRIGRLFRQINDLPWVADSRITVDYYPGQAKSRVRPRPAHRPILSWYNRHAFPLRQNAGVPVSLDLNAGSPSPPGQPPVMVQGQAPVMVQAQPSQPVYQPMLLNTVPSDQLDVPAVPAEPILPPLTPPPPPRSETGFSAHTGRSVVYSVVNPSAPSSSASTSPRDQRKDMMSTVAQNTTGYTPYQPYGSRYGPPIHDTPQMQQVASPSAGGTDPRHPPSAHTRSMTPAQSAYPYPLYTPAPAQH